MAMSGKRIDSGGCDAGYLLIKLWDFNVVCLNATFGFVGHEKAVPDMAYELRACITACEFLAITRK
jgi:hypothetical protein